MLEKQKRQLKRFGIGLAIVSILCPPLSAATFIVVSRVLAKMEDGYEIALSNGNLVIDQLIEDFSKCEEKPTMGFVYTERAQ